MRFVRFLIEQRDWGDVGGVGVLFFYQVESVAESSECFVLGELEGVKFSDLHLLSLVENKPLIS